MYAKLSTEEKLKITTLGELKAAGYQSKSVKDELRDNLILKLKEKQNPFPEIWGYEDTVIPELERAILSKHNINLLGLRGQAKTRIARLMIHLLDEVIPVVKGSELNDDPLAPLSYFAKAQISEKGDDTPIIWWNREERFTEKLATPDVSVADLVGDIDPIKAATNKLSYSDERVIHYGLIPRSHRSIFVINELPDLQPRIQVALFNILQEGDIQIRGFKLRLPLDIQFVFTANPEDYTNRGSIVTPLKDRIESQIITHYPKEIEVARKITEQEAQIQTSQKEVITSNLLANNLIEQIAFEARESEFVDEKSGVSARLTISAMENLYSSAERRLLINGEESTYIRVSDLMGTIPAITGKIELVYEGEQEGAGEVAQSLISKAIRKQFLEMYPSPEKVRKDDDNPYQYVLDWFGNGHKLDIINDVSTKMYQNLLDQVPTLRALVTKQNENLTEEETFYHMEFVLHGLAEFSQLSKHAILSKTTFSDLLSGMMNFSASDFEDEE
ncbi:magnesium chelatase [Flammeovirga yaeyamensis]|uniref:Magnesium chelatase n=1 Tax=Flammeovirga yaeyamensis TaxID=367791 RepID=A0AAX1NAS1_9BACT|nr:magnesium chelatase [Flammeovirga yaeyamensis]MBB3699290.1 magnesium chelatase subunit I [Flammeovirga yaeyamensis]NMF35447.1 magnesium chelatase [Flammeovirga yaeyamensis]QWG04307.1 magnesium chelatase [Flammeovirga yaeyamensis]